MDSNETKTASGIAKYTATMEVHKKWARMIFQSLSEEETRKWIIFLYENGRQLRKVYR
jgi:hypothetical protein